MITSTDHFIKSSPNWHWRRKGFTLVEILIVVTLGSMIMAGVTSSYIFLFKSSIGMGNYVDMNQQSRFAMELFGRDVRNASEVYTMTSSVLSIEVPSTTSSNTVTYAYNAEAKTLTRTVGGVSRSILTDVNSLIFTYYNLKNVVAAGTVEAKKVQIEVEMIRKILTLENTNHVISSRYMMRNRRVTN